MLGGPTPLDPMPRPDPAARLRAHLGLEAPGPVEAHVGAPVCLDGYERRVVRYEGLEGDAIPAYLFTPLDREARGAVVVFHQHAGAFHLGKSEVAGLGGDPHQALGPALARRGVAVLTPDALTFEDRRAGASGTEPADGDWLQHYNALAYRLLEGDTLMRKHLDDAQRAVSVLGGLEAPGRVGVVGHSFGGLEALYLAALDARVRFAVVSGALCSVGARVEAGTGINMFEVVPGLAGLVDAADLVRSIAPRPLLVVSSTDDPHSADADRVVEAAGAPSVEHVRVEGPHALDAGRVEVLLDWVEARAAEAGPRSPTSRSLP